MGYIPAMEYVPFFRGNLAAILKKHICAYLRRKFARQRVMLY